MPDAQRSARSTAGDTTRVAAAGGATEVITFEDVSFGYDRTNVLEGVDFGIAPGETVGIIGPSGSGKSTLLRLIAGFDEPRSGRVTCNTDDSANCPISMMFQTDTTLPWLRAEQNVLLFSRFRKWRRSRRTLDLKQHARDLLAMVHLEDAAKRYPYQLSGGMKRRLAFATAVAPQPQLLLLDEPFSSVDEPTRIKIHQDVYNIVKELNLTTILVTHDLAEALSLCDRILILSNRPASVVAEHHIDFGPDRQLVHLRDQPEFMKLYGAVWSDLSEQL
ncbi:spermidine/putrescine ABC transporter ATP-binding protein [Prauserella sp. PE36]|nr:spermidine/putrescine ABC transporter ATP-binding protein [Prauserella sp. PE36]